MADNLATPAKAAIPTAKPPTPSPGNKHPGGGDDPPAKRFRPNYADVINVLVGEDETKVVVHKAMICSKSPFFAAACSKNWEEGQNGILRLPEHQPAIFTMCLHWFYTQTLDMSIVEDNPEEKTCYLSLLPLWSLAHYLQVPELCNKTIDVMLDRHRQYPKRAANTNALKLPCEITPLASGLRRLLVDMTVSVFNGRQFVIYGAGIPQEFVSAIACKLLAGEQKLDSNPLNKPRCYYHDHNDSDPKCA